MRRDAQEELRKAALRDQEPEPKPEPAEETKPEADSAAEEVSPS